MKYKVSAVIVTYNRVKLLKECLSHVLNQTGNYLSHVFVINNNSSDNTKEYLSQLNNDKVIPINLTKNLGGAGGFSLGTKIAFERSNDNYFWLMDDDSMPTDTALLSLVNASKELNNKFGFLCSNVRWKNREPCLANVPQVSSDWNEYITKGLVKLTTATFVSVFVKRDIVKELGLPIADMFIWGDDTEYTTRLSRFSRSYLVSNSIVNHNSAKNLNNGSVFNAQGNRIHYYKYAVRNVLYVFRRYYNFSKVAKLLLSDIFTLLEIPFRAKNKRLLRCLCEFKGILEGMFFKPEIKFPK